jgi:hypothetical protein
MAIAHFSNAMTRCSDPDCFRVRVALLGDNQSKYPREFQAEAFGPGRKDGWRPTWQEG